MPAHFIIFLTCLLFGVIMFVFGGSEDKHTLCLPNKTLTVSPTEYQIVNGSVKVREGDKYVYYLGNIVIYTYRKKCWHSGGRIILIPTTRIFIYTLKNKTNSITDSVVLDSYSPTTIIRHFILNHKKEIDFNTPYTFSVEYIPIELTIWFKKDKNNDINYIIQII